MARIEYPATLPSPSAAPVQMAERRAVPSMAGPFEARPLWRERVGTQSVEFVFTRDEADLFFRWWREDLKLGGAWFVARWPHPSGWVRIERQFTSAPKQSYIDGGLRRVSVDTQFRGGALD